MTLIEGIGDEVTQFFVLLFVIIIGIIAWWSTNISEQPLIRTVLILESRRSHRVVSLTSSGANTTTPSPNIETTLVSNQENTPSEETPVETNSNEQPKESNQSSSNAANPNTPEESANTPNLEDPSRSNDEVGVCFSELRQRRANFLANRQATLIEASTETSSTSSENPPPENSENAENNSAGSIRIKLMYLNDNHKLVEGQLQEKLGEFKRRHFSLELAADKRVRLIFNGQVLQSDSETLQAYGLFDNCAVHCLVHSHRSAASPLNELNRDATNSNNSNANNEGSQHREWDLCNILFISLSLLLGIAWYCRYQYSQLFNWTTTVALIGFTGMLTVSFVSIYVPDQDGLRL